MILPFHHIRSNDQNQSSAEPNIWGHFVTGDEEISGHFNLNEIKHDQLNSSYRLFFSQLQSNVINNVQE